MGAGFLQNLRAGKQFGRRRARMDQFRKTYLVEASQPRIRFLPGLRKLSYRCYVVGSDQIWNPDITYGLRRAYFGAFQSPRKARVITYAASFGGAALPARYEKRFAALIQNLDAVSLRETGAIPYVQRFFPGEVTGVLDPVFFLGNEEWEKMENAPNRGRYILIYTTEQNRSMFEYVRELAQRTGLPVVELRPVAEKETDVDAEAGPAEFLGYVHHAEYVVTNSFHAAAFSIIFKRPFLVFAHSKVNERLASLLTLHGLEDRFCQDGGAMIDASIDWPAVRERTAAAAALSREFLMKNISGGPK